MNKLVIGLSVVLALILGLALGRLSTRGDLKLKDQEIARLNAATQTHTAAETTRSTASFRAARVEPMPEAPAPEDRGDRTNAPSGRGRRSDRMMWGFFGGPTSSNFVAEWQAQMVSARSNFFANASLSPELQAQFDGTIGEMNVALKDKAAFWSEAVKEGKITGPEMFLRMTTDFSSALVQAYDGMDKSMPPNWREKAGNNFSVMRFVDPSIRESFRALRPPRGGPGGGGPGGPPPAQ